MKSLTQKAGFTLLELVLSIALISILFGMSSVILEQGLNSYNHIAERGGNVIGVRYAMERMSKELRGLAETNDLQNIQPTQLAFFDEQNQLTSFNLNGQELHRGVDVLANNVSYLNFTGFRSDNTTTTIPSEVRSIQIELTTVPTPGAAPLQIRNTIFLRNYLYENFK